MMVKQSHPSALDFGEKIYKIVVKMTFLIMKMFYYPAHLGCV
jgi:hypothetical protein